MRLLKTALCGSAALIISLPLNAQIDTAPTTATPPAAEDSTTAAPNSTTMDKDRVGKDSVTVRGINEVGEKIATVDFATGSADLSDEQKKGLQDFAKAKMGPAKMGMAYILATPSASEASQTTGKTTATGPNTETTTSVASATKGENLHDQRVQAVRSTLEDVENLTIEIVEEPQMTGATATPPASTSESEVDTAGTEITSSGEPEMSDTEIGATGTRGSDSASDEQLKNQMRSFAEADKIVVGISAKTQDMSH